MTPPDSRTLGKEWLLYLPTVIGPAVLGLVSLVVLTHWLEPRELGSYALALAAGTTVAAVLGDWLVPVVLRFMPEYESSGSLASFVRSTIRVGEGLALVAAVLVLLLLIPVVPMDLVMAGALSAVSLVLAKVPMAVVRSEGQTKLFVWFSLVTAFASLAGGMMMFLITRSPASFLWASAVANGLLAVWARRRLRSKLHASGWLDRGAVLQLFRFGVPIALTAIGSQVLLLGDRYVIEVFRGSAEVGLYAPGYSVAERMMGFAFAPLFSALYPMAARAWAVGDRTGAMTFLTQALRWFVLLGGFAATMLWAFSESVTGLLLGPAYSGSAQVMSVVSIGTLIWFIGIISHQVLELDKRPHIITALGSGVAVLNVAINILFVPRFGFIAAAWTTFASYSVYLVLVRWLGLRTVGEKVRLPLASLSRVASFAFLTWLLKPLWRGAQLGEAIIWAVGASMLYIVLLWGSRELSWPLRGRSEDPGRRQQ